MFGSPKSQISRDYAEGGSRLIVAITGSPGVGKTTISRLLAERLEARHIDLSKLALEEGLVEEWDAERDTAIVDIEAVRREIEKLQRRYERLIIEGHYAHDVAPRGSWIFVLRRAPWRLRDELEERGYDAEKVGENVEAELLGVCLSEAVETHGSERVHEVDTTDKTPQEIVEEIYEVLRGVRPPRIGVVDWLDRPEAKQLLEWLGDVSHR